MILLVDGNNLAHISYHTEGALVGFVNKLLKIIYKYNPDEIFIAWDTPKKDYWRKTIWADYKGNRETNVDVEAGIKQIKQFLRDAKIAQRWEAQQEADDLLATYARIFHGEYILICTKDKDVLQLVSPQCTVLWGNKVLTTSDVFYKYGVRVSQLRDYLALMGDSSDNIPGIKGIGKERAIKLLHEFNDIGTIKSNIKWLPDDGQLFPRLSNIKLKHMFENIDLDLMVQLVTLNNRCFTDPGGGMYDINDIKSTMRNYK